MVGFLKLGFSIMLTLLESIICLWLLEGFGLIEVFV
jgi:hypothetical protein